MKKNLFFAMVCIISLASCSDSVKKVKIAENLYAQTVKGDDGQFVTSVCQVDGKEIVAPLKDVTFAVKDSLLIVAFGSDDSRSYYSMSGTPLGKLRLFKKVSGVAEPLYSGIDVATGKTVFYFPATQEKILTDRKFLDRAAGVLGYLSDKGFALKRLEDGKEYVVPTPSYYVRHNGDPVKIVVADKKTATIYDITGEKQKTLPLKQWENLRKKGEVELDFKGIICVIKIKKPL